MVFKLDENRGCWRLFSSKFGLMLIIIFLSTNMAQLAVLRHGELHVLTLFKGFES